MTVPSPVSAAEPASLPKSDVSSWVGLAGLLSLLVWIVICRNWPAIAVQFDLPGPRKPMSGPYAALAGLVFTALPMVLVSVLVDKVHLRPSTGIDWRQKRPVSAALDTTVVKLAGLWATWAIIGAFYWLARWYWGGSYLFAMQVLGVAIVPLLVLSVPYVLWLDRVLINPRDGAWHFGAMLIGREAYDRAEIAHHLRAWAVKGFFTAFMISIVPGGFADLITRDWSAALFNPVLLCGVLVAVMFVIDEQIGTVGYILTFKPLDAQIRSANPYLAGWLAALMCYPPFQQMEAGRPLFYQTATADWSVWLFGFPALQWLWAAMLVFLTIIYAWATQAFGIRFSNLTYRGVLTNGPYRYTRHPAYLSKNAFWWLATLPFLVTNGSATDAIRNTVCLAGVSAIYYWRAKTEEKHLLAEDPKYREYSDWMQQNGPVTRRLAALGQVLWRRGT